MDFSRANPLVIRTLTLHLERIDHALEAYDGPRDPTDRDLLRRRVAAIADAAAGLRKAYRRMGRAPDGLSDADQAAHARLDEMTGNALSGARQFQAGVAVRDMAMVTRGMAQMGQACDGLWSAVATWGSIAAVQRERAAVVAIGEQDRSRTTNTRVDGAAPGAVWSRRALGDLAAAVRGEAPADGLAAGLTGALRRQGALDRAFDEEQPRPMLEARTLLLSDSIRQLGAIARDERRAVPDGAAELAASLERSSAMVRSGLAEGSEDGIRTGRDAIRDTLLRIAGLIERAGRSPDRHGRSDQGRPAELA